MAPVRRTEGDPLPKYEAGSDCFTLEVIHGGFFVGYGSNRAYVDGHKVFYDDCEADTWSSLWLDDIIENLGYESGGRIVVYWLLPGMQINEDGLRLIAEDKDALSMTTMVQKGHRYLMVYLDHDPARNVVQWDHDPGARLKAVAERRDVADQAKFEAAMAKLQKEEEIRVAALEKKKSEALAKKLAAEEKRRAEREAKQQAAEEKKRITAENRKKAQEEKLALADKKKLEQEARKNVAEAAKVAKKKEEEARKQATLQAKKKEQEARIRIEQERVQNMQQEEVERQKAWEEHLIRVQMAREQSLKDDQDRAELHRIVASKEKRKLEEEGRSSTWTAFKKPRKSSMFDYLKGPPPGKPGHGNF